MALNTFKCNCLTPLYLKGSMHRPISASATEVTAHADGITVISFIEHSNDSIYVHSRSILEKRSVEGRRAIFRWFPVAATVYVKRKVNSSAIDTQSTILDIVTCQSVEILTSHEGR